MSHGGDDFDTVLNTLASDGSTEFGARGARIDVLRTVAGPFSTVRRVRVESPRGITHAYIKILKPRRPGEDELEMLRRMLTREYQATSALYDALRQDGEIGAVRPIASLPEHRAIVTEEVSGRSFAEWLKNTDTLTDEVAAIAARVGRWVRTYQELLRIPDVVHVGECRQYLDARLKLLEGRVLSAGDRRQTLALFDDLADLIGTTVVPAVPIHADLSPTNIIVSQEGRVTVLDFTMAKAGTRHHDLTHAHFHLELLALRHRRKESIYRWLQKAMLAGFDPVLDASDPLFRMMLLQHAVCHVALLAERRIPFVDRAYRWFLRRRWLMCGRIDAGRRKGLRVA